MLSCPTFCHKPAQPCELRVLSVSLYEGLCAMKHLNLENNLSSNEIKWHVPSLIRVFTVHMKNHTAKTLIRLGAQSFCWFCHEAAHLFVMLIASCLLALVFYCWSVSDSPFPPFTAVNPLWFTATGIGVGRFSKRGGGADFQNYFKIYAYA